MTEELNTLLKLIGNDVAALIEMVGDLQKQTAGESLSNQMKFRRDKLPYTSFVSTGTSPGETAVTG
jgi:hypothetical protein